MSTIGKVFVVLNLLLAGLFLGYASTSLAATDDFTEQLANERDLHSATRSDLEGKLAELNVQLNQLRERADLLTNERDAEKARADRAEGESRERKARLDQLTTSVDGIQSGLTSLDGKMGDVEAAKDAAVAARIEAERERDAAMDERDAALTAQRDAEDAARQLENQLAALEIDLTTTKESLGRTDLQLKKVVAATGVDPEGFLEQPPIDAAVVDVDMSLAPGLVALNVGSSQGVEKGFVFEIYSNEVYKGRVRVQDVSTNVSSAIVLGLVSGSTISRGDRATTNL